MEDFINQRQGYMSVKGYFLKFTHLPKYDPDLLPNSRACMSKFVTEVSNLVIKECMNSIFIKYMYIAQLINHSQ